MIAVRLPLPHSARPWPIHKTLSCRASAMGGQPRPLFFWGFTHTHTHTHLRCVSIKTKSLHRGPCYLFVLLNPSNDLHPLYVFRPWMDRLDGLTTHDTEAQARRVQQVGYVTTDGHGSAWVRWWLGGAGGWMIQTEDSEFVVIGCLCVLIMVAPPFSGAPRLYLLPSSRLLVHQ